MFISGNSSVRRVFIYKQEQFCEQENIHKHIFLTKYGIIAYCFVTGFSVSSIHCGRPKGLFPLGIIALCGCCME